MSIHQARGKEPAVTVFTLEQSVSHQDGEVDFQLQFFRLGKKPGATFSILNLFILIILKRVLSKEY